MAVEDVDKVIKLNNQVCVNGDTACAEIHKAPYGLTVRPSSSLRANELCSDQGCSPPKTALIRVSPTSGVPCEAWFLALLFLSLGLMLGLAAGAYRKNRIERDKDAAEVSENWIRVVKHVYQAVVSQERDPAVQVRQTEFHTLGIRLQQLKRSLAWRLHPSFLNQDP